MWREALAEVKTETAALVRGAMRIVRRQPLAFWVAPAIVVLVALACIPLDAGAMPAAKPWIQHPRAYRIAGLFSKWGDLPTGTLIVTALVWGAGVVRRKVNWRRAAIASLLAAVLAGGLTAATRGLTGRPRPNAGLPDRFTGPSLHDRFHSFPSSHAATSMATAGALACAVPEFGVPVAIVSLGVPWSRYMKLLHHPTDIAVGMMVGLWFGCALGRAARDRAG